MEPYYYQKMTKIQQATYHAMKMGLTSLSPAFAVPRVEAGELADIFFQLRLDCPEIFYAVSYRYKYYPEASNVEFVPEYLFEKGKILEHQKAMKARVAKLARPAASMSEWEKELYIHDFVCENVRYDKLKKPYSHEIIGPLGQGVGVCEGIAKTVKILCDALGIWCIIAISDSNPEKKIKYRHAWNVVKIGGKYYHLDATFDNSLGSDGIIRHDYVNLGDKSFFRDHEPVIYGVPKCEDGDHFYYKEKKLSFTKMEDVSKRTLQAIRRNIPLLFHWRGGYLTKETLSELLTLLEQKAQQKGIHVKVGINRAQAVFCVTFHENKPQSEFIDEDANEGESMK